MEVMLIHPRLDELLQIEEMLLADRILLDAYDIDSDHPYRIINYHMGQIDQFTCLLDRNIVSGLISLIRRTSVPQGGNGKKLRLVAGLQTFLIVSKIVSDPSIAYEEYIDGVGIAKADKELASFRSADNLDPDIYLDIALGKRTLIPAETIKDFPRGELLSKELPPKLKHFQRNLVTMKKALVIRERCASDYETMLRLTDWLYDDYIFTAPAFHFLSVYFSSGRIRKMLKSHEIRGVRNATWDLCFLQQWVEHERNSSENRWLAATRDRGIKKIAQLMFIKYYESKGDYWSRLEEEYSKMWSARNKFGRELLDKLLSFEDSLDDPSRKIASADAEYVLSLDKLVDEEYDKTLRGQF